MRWCRRKRCRCHVKKEKFEIVVVRSIFVNGGEGIFQQQTLFVLVRKNIKKTITIVITCTVDAIKNIANDGNDSVLNRKRSFICAKRYDEPDWFMNFVIELSQSTLLTPLELVVSGSLWWGEKIIKMWQVRDSLFIYLYVHEYMFINNIIQYGFRIDIVHFLILNNEMYIGKI